MMTPNQIVSALEKEAEMTEVIQISNKEYRGKRKGKNLTVRITKHRGQWQLMASDGNISVPSNTFPWQEAIFDGLHWYEFD